MNKLNKNKKGDKMYGLSLSGGSTKISGIAGAALTVMREYSYEPTHITGISAGSILSLPLALKKYDIVEDLSQNFKFDDVFNFKPVNEKGNITFGGIVRISTGRESLGKQDRLNKTLSKIITKSLFREYKTNDKYPIIYVGMIGYKTGSRKYYNLKQCSYDMALEAINASSSLPVMVESRKFNSEFWFDGGVRDHLGSHWLMEKFKNKIKEHISIYSRPKDYNIKDLEWEPKNALKVLERTLDIMHLEKSKNDEWKEDILSDKYNIKNTKIFLPIVSKGMYEFNRKKLKEWFKKGVDSARMEMSSAGY